MGKYISRNFFTICIHYYYYKVLLKYLKYKNFLKYFRANVNSVLIRALRAVLGIGNSSIFEQFRAVFTDFCSKMLGSNFVKLLEIARKLLEFARIIKKRSKI